MTKLRPSLLRLFAIAIFTFSPAPSFGIAIAPATADDIRRALGPDARGLDFEQEDLPDLFTLSSSRIEEDNARFMFEIPYESGRWKGGRAVLEYARDLSYTLVSIYDRNKRRQRIYSVKTRYAEHMARVRTGAPAVTAPPTAASTPALKSATATSIPNTEGAVVDIDAIPAGGAYAWDDEKGAYVLMAGAEETVPAVDVPVEEVPADVAAKPSRQKPRRTEASSRSRSKRNETVSDVATVSRKPSADAPPPSMHSSGIWVPASEKKSVKPVTTASGPSSVRVGGTKWVEKRERETSPEREPSNKMKKSAPVKETPVVVAKALPPVPEIAKVVDIDAELSVPANSRPKRAGRTEPEVTEPEPEPEPEEAPAPPPPSKSSKKSKPSRAQREPEPPVESVPEQQMAESVPEEPPPPTSKRKDKSQGFSDDQVPTTEDLLDAAPAPTGPTTADSDAWVPKDVKVVPAKEPVIPKEVEIAKKPVDSSLDAMLKMSAESKGSMPRESESWVPKKGAVSGTEAELNKELQRVRREEKERAKAATPKMKIRKDINNPEEGVLPVSSFEKMSGPMFGRHREYERRFRPGAMAKSKAPKHDFYVDEVDRKKEFHNIYFYQYQKGKPPKLVAVQRHQRVTFRGNYDIDKEDEGKLTVYN